MITHMSIRFLVIFTFLLIGTPIQAAAQSVFEDFPGAEELLQQFTNLNGEDGLSTTLLEELVTNRNPPTLKYSPANPGPNERVTITVQSYGASHDSSLINWYVDGALFSSGMGATTIGFSTRNIGSVSEVYAEIVDSSGRIVRTPITPIGPSHIDILWEAVDASTHPFYKGKALPSWDTIIKTYAVPEMYAGTGIKMAPSTLEYTWKKNQSALDLNEQSGYGKSAVYVLADFSRKQHRVGVELLHAATGTTSEKSVSIKLHDPEVLLYEKHPLQGVVFERALPAQVSQARSSGSLRVMTYPFGMDARNRGDIMFSWKLNGRPLNNTSVMRTGEIPLVSSEQAGVSTVLVETRNETKPLQSTKGSLRINVE